MAPGQRHDIESSLHQRFAEQVAFLEALVRMPSDNPPGDCAPHAARTASLLGDLGFEVEHHPVPDERCREIGMISVTNLVVRRQFGAGPTIALNAHGDVVPPGDGWTRPPYGAETIEGWMYGRGAAVSKSDFATYAFALLALHPLAASLCGTVELHLTYDEETGGILGPRWLLEKGISRPDLAIAAGFSYGVVTAHNGCMHLAVEVLGRSAHAAQPETGHDALEAANAVLSALYAHRRELARIRSAIPGITSPTLVVGLIDGGINTNVVPDRVTLRLDRRLVPEENPTIVEDDLRARINRAVCTMDGISVSIDRVLLAEPLVPLDGIDRLTEPLTRHASALMGEEVACHGVALYTDARHYAAAGIPTVLYGAGPRTLTEANAHRADERIAMEDLQRATEVVARTLADVLAC